MSNFDLDHTGILVGDLDAAAAQFRRLGFKLTERGYHTLPATPTGERPRVGTGNNCAMLRRGYVELIGVTDPHYDGRMREDLKLYEGLHLIAFGTSDAEAAAENVRASGFAAEGPRIMERPIEEDLARFEIVDFPPNALSGSHLFAIHHATPELLWKSEVMNHPNTAERLEAAVIAVEGPTEMAGRLGRLLSVSPSQGVLSLSAGQIRFVDRAWIAAHVPGRSPALPFIAGLTLGVRNLDATTDWLTTSGVSFARFEGGLRVPPSEACGAFIEFVG
jgi:catechol 2,3-dioxygenase-like lactoylglutathione lyase family enzyme